MSGSFIVSGQCHARLDKVGEDSYISRLTLEAKEMQQGEQSEMIRSLDRLVKCVGIAIIPISVLAMITGRNVRSLNAPTRQSKTASTRKIRLKYVKTFSCTISFVVLDVESTA